MKKISPVPPIPPLSFEMLDVVRKVEDYAQGSTRQCGDEWSFNTPKALRILRTCAVASLDHQISYYSSLSGYRPQWLAEPAETTINATVNLVGRAGAENWDYLRGELEQTVKEHLWQKELKARAAAAKPEKNAERKQIDRKKLRDEYLAEFDAKILDDCWAAGQHYLDAECQQEITKLPEELTFPDEALAAHLNQLLDRVEPCGRAAIRFLLLYAHEVDESKIKLPGFSADETSKSLRKCFNETLLEFRSELRSSVFLTVYYSVPDGFRETLKKNFCTGRDNLIASSETTSSV